MEHGAKIRIRWAAIGAAIAVTLGAGGVGIASATLASNERTSFVPITPCRITDTRPGIDNRGPRAAPIGPGETHIVSAWGTVGDCNITNQATGLVLNVTTVNQTQLTFLTIYPTGATQPLTSNLNPAPGQPPTPNAVTVDLNTSGQFSIYNLQGSVDVIVDVVGYYEDHNHDDRYYTKPETYSKAETYSKPETYSKTETYSKPETDNQLTEVGNAINRVVAIVPSTATIPTIERVIPTSDTISTPISGRLFITKALQSVLITCSSPAGIRYFLTLNGVPVETSVQTTGGGGLAPAVFIGITGVVAAGTHTIGIAAECTGAPTANAGTGLGNPSPANVMILN